MIVFFLLWNFFSIMTTLLIFFLIPVEFSFEEAISYKIAIIIFVIHLLDINSKLNTAIYSEGNLIFDRKNYP